MNIKDSDIGFKVEMARKVSNVITKQDLFNSPDWKLKNGKTLHSQIFTIVNKIRDWNHLKLLPIDTKETNV